MPLFEKLPTRVFILTACLTLAFRGVAFAPPEQDSKKCTVPVQAEDAKFKPGQVWKAKGREDEPDLTATVLRVESLEKVGVFIHVRVDHAAMHSCPGNSVWHSLEHAPMSKAAFEQSVTAVVRTDEPIPDYHEGYENWRSHCGGVYTIPIAEILSLNEKTARANLGCDGDN